MTTAERRDIIEEMIRENNEIEVSVIKEKFGVSSVTVRNDLIFLERKGVIKRLFGKAVLRDERLSSAFDVHSVKQIDEKEKIGKYAASIINPNESVMLYTGTTTLQIAKYLPSQLNVIAVTNSIYIAYELKKYPNVKTVVIGGNFNPDTGATYGIQAIRQLNDYNIDKLFLAVDGINADTGITNDQPYETDINRAMINKSKNVIVVADHTKVGVTRFINMGDIEKVDMLITDTKADDNEIKKIKAKNVKVVLA